MRAVDRGCVRNLAGCAASLGRQVAVLYHGSTSQAARYPRSVRVRRGGQKGRRLAISGAEFLIGNCCRFS